MRLRSGAEFAPYDLKHAYHPRTPPGNPIPTSIDVEPLLQGAAALEDLRFEQEEDDSEGLGVTSRPSSPLTEVESESEAEAPSQPPPGLGAESGAKKRRNAGAKKRRAKKRAKVASSGHQPHAYAANPSVTMHRSVELKPLRVSEDAGNFPASGSGSWVGLRKSGARKKAWTTSELVERNFTFVEWDGV
jgi:hypothetical protein